jgi:hypothetical protein
MTTHVVDQRQKIGWAILGYNPNRPVTFQLLFSIYFVVNFHTQSLVSPLLEIKGSFVHSFVNLAKSIFEQSR